MIAHILLAPLSDKNNHQQFIFNHTHVCVCVVYISVRVQTLGIAQGPRMPLCGTFAAPRININISHVRYFHARHIHTQFIIII